MKKFLGLLIVLMMIASNCLAMTFSQPVEIGEIGSPVQSPYHGFVVDGATENNGTSYNENRERRGKPLITYTKGTARFGDLYCKYNFGRNFNDQTISFGGKNNFILNMDGTFKQIFSIGNDSSLKLYAIRFYYCVTDLKIIGTRKDGKWVVYIDSKKLSDKYFGGKDRYKEDGGVIYDVPTCVGDKIVVTYRRWYWKGISEPEGEFRFKWDDKAQWFGIEQVVY